MFSAGIFLFITIMTSPSFAANPQLWFSGVTKTSPIGDPDATNFTGANAVSPLAAGQFVKVKAETALSGCPCSADAQPVVPSNLGVIITAAPQGPFTAMKISIKGKLHDGTSKTTDLNFKNNGALTTKEIFASIDAAGITVTGLQTGAKVTIVTGLAFSIAVTDADTADKITAGTAYINFDKDTFQVVDVDGNSVNALPSTIQPDTYRTLIVENVVNNILGTIKFTAGTSSTVSGPQNIGIVILKPIKGKTGATTCPGGPFCFDKTNSGVLENFDTEIKDPTLTFSDPKVDVRPLPPSGFAFACAPDCNHNIALSWTASTDAGNPPKYKIYKAKTSTFGDTLCSAAPDGTRYGTNIGGTNLTATACADDGDNLNCNDDGKVIPWNTSDSCYYYKVTALNGAIESVKTSTALKVGPDAWAPVVTAASIQAVNLCDNGATITWTTGTDKSATTDTVQHSLDADVSGSDPKVTAVKSSTTSATHSVNLTGLTAGTTYFYKVESKDKANNTSGFVAGTTDSFATTNGTPCVKPTICGTGSPPAATTDCTTDAEKITFTWKTNADSACTGADVAGNSMVSLDTTSVTCGSQNACTLPELQTGHAFVLDPTSSKDHTVIVTKDEIITQGEDTAPLGKALKYRLASENGAGIYSTTEATVTFCSPPLTITHTTATSATASTALPLTITTAGGKTPYTTQKVFYCSNTSCTNPSPSPIDPAPSDWKSVNISGTTASIPAADVCPVSTTDTNLYYYVKVTDSTPSTLYFAWVGGAGGPTQDPAGGTPIAVPVTGTCGGPPPPTTVDITLSIKDSTNQTALTGVGVNPALNSQTTVNDGQAITGVTPGSYTFSKAGYNALLVSITASGAVTVSLNPTSLPTGNLEVNVKESATGNAPIAGATVSVTGCTSVSGQTDSTGQYKNTAVPAGSCTISVTAATGYLLPSSQTKTVTAGATTTTEFLLDKAGAIICEAKDKNTSALINNLTCEALKSGESTAKTCVTGKDGQGTGKCKIDGLASGTYSVGISGTSANNEGYDSCCAAGTTAPKINVTLSSGETKTQSFSLIPLPVSTLTITPGAYSLAPGTSLQLKAVGRDKNGNTVTLSSIGWAFTNTSVGTITGTGETAIFQAIADGVGRIGRKGDSAKSEDVNDLFIDVNGIGLASRFVNIGVSVSITISSTQAVQQVQLKARETGQTTLSNVQGPFRAKHTTGILGFKLTQQSPIAQVTVKIYTLHGNLVKTIITNSAVTCTTDALVCAEWDFTDNQGRKVPNGVYMYQMDAISSMSKVVTKPKFIAVFR